MFHGALVPSTLLVTAELRSSGCGVVVRLAVCIKFKDQYGDSPQERGDRQVA